MPAQYCPVDVESVWCISLPFKKLRAISSGVDLNSKAVLAIFQRTFAKL